ncbi:MAG: autotransporter outer membrane beta-barrel domain-containing protein [Methylobacillus sp.]|nr:autotransporter outer membrane beta-barrel domain-containing protein [Methylobacillus sp.]
METVKFRYQCRNAQLRALALALLFVATAPVHAQIIDVTVPGSLTGTTGTTTPADGAVWNLQNDGVFLSTTLLMPVGATGLTINGNGHTLTLNDGAGAYGHLGVNPPNTFTTRVLNLSDITITGGSQPNGSAILMSLSTASGSNLLTMNLSGDVAFTDMANTSGGGSVIAMGIQSGTRLVINGDGGTFEVSNNTANGSNGIWASNIEIHNAGGKIIFSGNTANSGNSLGGTPFGGNITIDGTLLVENNVSRDGNGAISTGTIKDPVIGRNSVTINGGGSNLIFSNNAAGSNGAGGAIAAGTHLTINNTGGTLTMTDNTAGVWGGALSSRLDVRITGSVLAERNTAINGRGSGRGGAINTEGDIDITGPTITFTNNEARDIGGAIMASGLTTDGSGNFISGGLAKLTGSINFSENQAGFAGGAMAAVGALELDVMGNSTISGNKTNGTADTYGIGLMPGGGAFWIGSDSLLNATQGDITFNGNTANGLANAIWFENADLMPTLSVDDDILYVQTATGGKTATFNADAGRSITFYDPIENNAANGLLTVNKTGAGSVVFDGSLPSTASYQADPWSRIYGNTTVQAGTFTVRNNAIYGALEGDASGTAGNSIFTVNSGATLAGGILGEVRADNFILNGGLNIAGSAIPGTAAGGFSTFTVTSNNVNFGTGSQIRFNTLLNDASVQRSDILVLGLNGSATTGTARILVTNVGGLGAITTGDGIELVQVVGNNGTTANAFALAAPVAAGPYQYELFRGSVDGTTAPQNWYLRSTGNRPETSLYPALPSMALVYSDLLLDTLHERVGDEYVTDPNGTQPFWGRIIGMRGHAEDGGTEYYHDTWAMQGGFDIYRRQKTDGSSTRAGLYGALGTMGADVDYYGKDAGKNRLRGITLGGYWTRFTETGSYLDALAQYTWAKFSADPKAIKGFDTHGGIVALSLEVGKPYRIDDESDARKKRILEPQAQLIYHKGSMDSASDGAARVRFSDIESTTARLGVRYADIRTQPNSITTILWLRPSLLHTFQNEPTTYFSSATGDVPFEFDQSGSSFELAAGVERQRGEHLSLFLSGLYRVGLDGDSDDYGLKAGIKWGF